MSGTIFIVDDDPSVREGLALVLRIGGYVARTYPSAEEFLASEHAGTSGCIIADLRMPGMDGLALQRMLKEQGRDDLSIIFMTAFGDVATTRAALKGGAADFLEKPVREEMLLELVADVLERSGKIHEIAVRRGATVQRIASLTPREREVLDRIVAGYHNREIAAEFKISSRTVEVHKARIMAKLGVTRIPELMRLMIESGVPSLVR